MNKYLKNYTWSIYLRLISIITPHCSEEIAERGGFKGFISELKWPEYNEKYLKEKNVKIVVMLNGKKKGILEVPSDTNQKKLLDIVSSASNLSMIKVEKFAKIIFVKNKIINFVQ